MRTFATTLLITVLSFYLASCKKKNTLPEVKTISAMKPIMMGEDLSAHLHWDTINKANLFAVAPLERIVGEVTVINGKLYTSQVDSGKVVIDTSWDIRSPFAVYAYVPEWTVFELDTSVESQKDVQAILEEVASGAGYSLDKPFPFRVLGEFAAVDYHIISKPATEAEHNHELHKQAKQHFHLNKRPGELLGFYSRNHQGVFTHKGHFIHTHFMDKAKEHMGHLEDIKIQGRFEIFLPKM